MIRAYCVVNPHAGRFHAGFLAERATGILKKLDWQVELIEASGGAQIAQLASQAASDGVDVFLMVGGDGSINHALPGLINTQTALGVLPAGTANVWAQELGLPALGWTNWVALEESARMLAGGQIREVDVGYCAGQPFLLWAGIGLDGYIVGRIEPRPRWEKQIAVIHYAATAAINATGWHGMDLMVEVDGEAISGRYILAVASNIHLYAGGLARLSPNARLDDSQMDLWLFEGKDFLDTVQRAWDLLAGNHVSSERVRQFSFNSIRLEADAPFYLQLDGEPLILDKPELSIHVCPKALKVLVPSVPRHELFLQNHR
jgi:diacylglycerol kinase family enzyme